MIEPAFSNRSPSPEDAISLLKRNLGKEVASITRFQRGYAHYVYDVRTSDGNSFVVRMTTPAQSPVFRSAIYWHARLTRAGVPLAEIFAHDAEPLDGSFPYIIMERFPGRDLNDAYPGLTPREKKAIATRLVDIQGAVKSLPRGSGFGFATSYEDASLHSSWLDVLRSQLKRSRQRIRDVGAVDPIHVDHVEARLQGNERYFSEVAPEAFLDDTTTKNVIIHNGTVSGIVDTDYVCFGDQLFTVALTRMSLLSSGFETDYIDYWCSCLHLDTTQRKALNLYTALFCVDFLGELGHQFNRASNPAVNRNKVAQLLLIFNDLLGTALS